MPAMTRRAFLASAAAAAALAPFGPVRAAGTTGLRLRAAPSSVRLAPAPYGETAVWCYGGSVPGPEIRVRQGERVRVVLDNSLDEDTTIHWHGLRLPNAMDGVPDVTQPPVRPGGTFVYEFDAVDAGTFWYHPHSNSMEQVARGLYGVLVVEEREPALRVDRDVTWVLDDWRMTEEAALADGFGNAHDMSHAGRLGNWATVNGSSPGEFAVRGGERIRLRLVNTANARVFGLEFRDHRPQVVALDGHPVAPHAPEGGRVVLGPGMRADIVLDMAGEPGAKAPVIDAFYRNREYRLLDLAYASEPLRREPPDWPLVLPPNPLPEPEIEGAVRLEMMFTGGAMGGAIMAEMGGRMGPVGPRSFWFVDGEAPSGDPPAPMLTLKRGRSCIIAMTNATAWHHPMHLHGHAFRILSRNGRPAARREWRDTVLMDPRETVEIAFLADNPGDWLFHCHVLGHQASGMKSMIRVF